MFVIRKEETILIQYSDSIFFINITRTAGAAGPLVLESGAQCFFCILPHTFLFQYGNFLISSKFLPQMLTTHFTTNHYHNWGDNIYYHTNFIFLQLPHIFTTNFTLFF